MNYNDHSKLKGAHASFGASKCSWLNKDEEAIISAFTNSKAQELGTALHDISRGFIEERVKFRKVYKPCIILMLRLFYHIPRYAVNITDESIENMQAYVNDAIGYHMSPEVVLYYSDFFFGTADAIDFRNNLLRIHDLKTGSLPVHKEQLYIYAALFCLEYDVKPGDINIELRIYQNNEIQIFEPTAEDILPIMDKIVTFDKVLQSVRNDN